MMMDASSASRKRIRNAAVLCMVGLVVGEHDDDRATAASSVTNITH